MIPESIERVKTIYDLFKIKNYLELESQIKKKLFDAGTQKNPEHLQHLFQNDLLIIFYSKVLENKDVEGIKLLKFIIFGATPSSYIHLSGFIIDYYFLMNDQEQNMYYQITRAKIIIDKDLDTEGLISNALNFLKSGDYGRAFVYSNQALDYLVNKKEIYLRSELVFYCFLFALTSCKLGEDNATFDLENEYVRYLKNLSKFHPEKIDTLLFSFYHHFKFLVIEQFVKEFDPKVNKAEYIIELPTIG